MKIDIGIYYGPIDLLVYLVRKKEVDIFDIPIAQVAEEYLDYIRKIERKDLEDAADFLLMAAILIRLKVRSLLPRTPEDEEEAKPITLMQIIEEYKKYKEIAKYFGEMETQTSKQYPRFARVEPTTVLEEGDLMSLILAFRSFKPSEKEEMLVKRQSIPIEKVIEDLTRELEERGRVNFLKFLKEKRNVSIAVSYFFGMLQIVKEGLASVEQNEIFGEIYLYKRQQEIIKVPEDSPAG
ncbi:MAG: segregation/condensation protein A [candidate division WOR-3 bacterium]|nr:segregation/condensation protein A [candidate division WOR-3 bacterium]